MLSEDGIMKIEVTKFQMIIGAEEDHVIELFDYLNKPGYDVTIEHIGKTIITIEKKDSPLNLNTRDENE